MERVRFDWAAAMAVMQNPVQRRAPRFVEEEVPLSFLEVEIAGTDTWLPSLAARGLCADFMFCPDGLGGRRVAWVAENAPALSRPDLRQRLLEQVDDMVELDLHDGRWIGSGRVDVARACSSLRTYLSRSQRFELPWVHLDGAAFLRLRPRDGTDLLVEQERLQQLLDDEGAYERPRIRSYHMGIYDRLRETLHQGGGWADARYWGAAAAG